MRVNAENCSCIVGVLSISGHKKGPLSQAAQRGSHATKDARSRLCVACRMTMADFVGADEAVAVLVELRETLPGCGQEFVFRDPPVTIRINTLGNARGGMLRAFMRLRRVRDLLGRDAAIAGAVQFLELGRGCGDIFVQRDGAIVIAVELVEAAFGKFRAFRTRRVVADRRIQLVRQLPSPLRSSLANRIFAAATNSSLVT